ncbi:GNAT family N-acetyltransferase [Psychrobium sp. nBUS_13]|uniref:GNAT family N-acetyltransferase n=1 Tax=Psychrobium sp. nBUS_13 TaxID=3395319 RepID=UPI003EB71947
MKINQATIHTPRVLSNDLITMRLATIDDLDNIRAYRGDPENCQYIAPVESLEETRELVEKLSQPWQFTTGYWNGLVVCKHNNNKVIGEIVFRVEDWDCQRAEIGYRMSPESAGKGICTMATSLLIDYLFEQFDFYKLVAKCDARNVASYRVMEKLGFKREAEFMEHYRMGDEWTDQYDYGLLRNQ